MLRHCRAPKRLSLTAARAGAAAKSVGSWNARASAKARKRRMCADSRLHDARPRCVLLCRLFGLNQQRHERRRYIAVAVHDAQHLYGLAVHTVEDDIRDDRVRADSVSEFRTRSTGLRMRSNNALQGFFDVV